MQHGNSVHLTGKPNWKIAAYTGLIVAIIFLLTPGGDPWGYSVLMRPMVMGREITTASQQASELNFGYLALHIVLSMAFVLIMAPLLSRVLFAKALFVGALFGLLFYGANRLAFSLLPISTMPGETRVVITNICFGLLAAAVYRGMARGRLTTA